MNSGRVVVLGGGLAGLGFARHWPCCRVFEAEAEPGGYARSHEFAGAWFDQGAHICHSQDPAWLEELAGAGPLHEMSRSVVLNHKAGHWFAYPVQNHLAELSAEDCAAAVKDFQQAQEKYRGREPRNYEEWCRFQYGDFLLENFYRLYTAKYWHVPMAELATDWLGGRLLPSQVETILAGARARQEESQAVFRTFRYPRRGGFFGLAAHLYKGIDLHVNKRAMRVDAARRRVEFSDGTAEDYGILVATVPLPALIRMMPEAPADVCEAAGKLRALRHYCVNVIVDRENLSPAQWFYVYDPDMDVSRVSFPFSLSGTTSGKTAVQAEIFRPADARPGEESLRDKAVDDLARILGFDHSAVSAAEIRCYPVAYVISDLNRAAAVDHVRTWLSGRGIETAGLFGNWAYIWSDRAYAGGRNLARTLGNNA